MSDDIQDTSVRMVPTGDAGREGWVPLEQTWPKDSQPDPSEKPETVAEFGERYFGGKGDPVVNMSNEPGEAKRFIVTQALARADQAAALFRESLAWMRVVDSPLADEHVEISVGIDAYINVLDVKHGSG